jgi:hypothetical protein
MTNIITVPDAIQALRPTSNFTLSGSVIEWLDTEQTQPTEAEIDAEVIRLQAEFDAQEYARARQPLYPDIGDQLDDLYHKGAFSAEMTATIKKVKDDNPK